MRIDRLTLSEAEAQTALADLILTHIQRAYVTAGEPGVMAAVRDMLGRMDPVELRALAESLDLIAEPAAENDDLGPGRGRLADEG